MRDFKRAETVAAQPVRPSAAFATKMDNPFSIPDPASPAMMNPDNPVIKLCQAGTRAQFHGRADDACALFWQAWQAAGNDCEKCIAAHYVAGCQTTPEAVLQWHQEALTRANAAGAEQVKGFYPSLYVNLGQAHEVLGHTAEARWYYAQAAELGLVHASNGPRPEIGQLGRMLSPRRK